MRLTGLAVAGFLLSVAMVVGQASAEETWVFTTHAGVTGGAADGVGAHARFYIPYGVAVDANGNVFVADSGNHTIRKITRVGVVSTFAGLAGATGSADGKGSAARFMRPQDVAVDRLGTVYVTDSGNLTIRRITPDGVVSTLAGLAGNSGSFDGTGEQARFRSPGFVAIGIDSNLYVTDAVDNTIRRVTPAGVVTTYAGRAGASGSTNGQGGTARFAGPAGIDVAPNGNLYIADSANAMIRRITPSGTVSTLAGRAGNYGSTDGSGSIVSFTYPFGIAVNASGSVFVSDFSNLNLRKVTPDGVTTTFAGLSGVMGNTDGPGSAARFTRPAGLSADAEGNIFVCDYDGYSIRKVTPSGVVSTFAGTSSGGSDDGGPGVARFLHPTDVAVDAHGAVFVADMVNNAIRKIAPDGKVTTVAGLAGTQGSADGIGSAARFHFPSNLALAATGELFVSDRNNATVRKLATNGTVTTFAGTAGEQGSADGTGPDARFGYPYGLAVDAAGNVFVADGGFNTIKKISPAGVVKTFAGRAGGNATVDGSGIAARFNGPSGVAIGTDGSIFVSEIQGATIRRITPAGAVTTFAGLAGVQGTADATGSAARFNAPSGIGVERNGDLIVVDQGAQTVRKVTPAASVSTLGGKPFVYGWNNGAGSDARFDTPVGATVDANGVVYVAEYWSNSIRRGVRCVTGSICALNGRFQLSLAAVDPRTGATGPGVPMQQNDLFGYFSIPGLTGNERNPEVFVKMLDGRGVNGNYWVFYGGLTDFEYTLTVKDTVTGKTATYKKPGGSSAGGFDVGDGVASESCAGGVEGTPVAPPATSAPCTVQSDRLCLNAGRFGIEVDARDPRSGKSGVGMSIAGDDLFGYFALPELTGNASNPEVFVKMLDGRAENGHYWFFFSGLTDLEYTVTVTDSVTGVRKRYDKAAGSACGAFDVNAF